MKALTRYKGQRRLARSLLFAGFMGAIRALDLDSPGLRPYVTVKHHKN
jgi:hypothetical protein